MDFLKSGLLVGLTGDATLQLANQTSLGNAGLRSYFNNQSSLGALLRASLLTGLSSYLFAIIFEPSLRNFLIYAAGLDVIYRYWHAYLLFPDLNEYYNQNSFIATIFYNDVTALLVYYGRVI